MSLKYELKRHEYSNSLEPFRVLRVSGFRLRVVYLKADLVGDVGKVVGVPANLRSLRQHQLHHLVCGLRLRGGLVFEAHRLLYQSTLGLRVIKKKTFRVQDF